MFEEVKELQGKELSTYDPVFIEPEIRDGWSVSEETKKVWWIQLEILKEFDRICKKNDLRWFPIGGILIGVIRHKGFIPWDDDVDVAMPREDYNRFMEICKTEVKEPYFLQTPFTDVDCYQTWISLRDSRTTGNRVSCLKTKQNNGIGIDILTLEGCESSLLRYKMRRFPLMILSTICNTYVNEFNTTPKAIFIRRILRRFPINYLRIHRFLEKHNSKHTWDKYDNVTLTLLADPIAKDVRHIIWKKEDFSSTIDMPFEGMMIPVPIGYDRILRTEFGDYMKFPPVEKRVGKHAVVFAPDVPYKKYCSEQYGVQYNETAKND